MAPLEQLSPATGQPDGAAPLEPDDETVVGTTVMVEEAEVIGIHPAGQEIAVVTTRAVVLVVPRVCEVDVAGEVDVDDEMTICAPLARYIFACCA